MTAPQEHRAGVESAETYLPFVRKIASRIARRLPQSVELEDLVSAGTVGLMEAMDRYDPQGGRRFESYAEFRIKGAILDELRRCDPLNRSSRHVQNQIQNKTARLHAAFGRPPEPEEIAAAMGTSVDNYLGRLSRVNALRVVAMDTDAVNPGDFGAAIPNQEDLLGQRELVLEVQGALAQLTERQRLVLNLYYVEELTQSQVGEVLNVTESRVCQILSELVRRLRHTVSKEVE